MGLSIGNKVKIGSTSAANQKLVNLPLTVDLNGKVAGGLTFGRASVQWGIADRDDYGPNIVSNGGFDSEASWTLTGSWGIAGGVVSAASELGAISQNCLTVGMTYLVTYTVTSCTAGSVVVKVGMNMGTARTAPGTYSESLQCTTDGLLRFQGLAFSGSIDNVSVQAWTPAGTVCQVPAGVPFINSKGILLEPASVNKCTCYGAIPADTLGAELVTNAADRQFDSDTGWWTKSGSTIAGGVATINSASGFIERGAILVAGRVYTATFTVSGYTSGSVGISGGTTTAADKYVNANGTFTRTFVADGTAPTLFRLVATVAGASFDNVSVKEVQFAIGTKSAYVSGAWVQNHTNITLSADQATTLTTIDATAAIQAAGLQGLAPSGKAYKVDTTGAAIGGIVTFSGVTGNTNNHSFSCYVIYGGASGLSVMRLSTTNGSSTTLVNTGGAFSLVKAENKVAVAGDSVQLRVNPNESVIFLIPQLEELVACTSPMPPQGATAARAATALSFPTLRNFKTNDFTVYVEFYEISSAVGSLIFGVTDGSVNVMRMNVAAGTLAAQKYLAGVPKGASSSAYNKNVANKAIARFSSSNGVTLFLNGSNKGANGTNDSIPLAATAVLGDYFFHGYIKNFRIYRKVLSDAQCVALTT